MVGISRDMRERKQLMDALRERERDLIEAHRIAGIGTWRWLRATDTVTWSDEIYRIYGVDKTYKPLGYGGIRDKKDAGPTQKLFVQAFERAEKFGEPFATDIEIARPDGVNPLDRGPRRSGGMGERPGCEPAGNHPRDHRAKAVRAAACPQRKSLSLPGARFRADRLGWQRGRPANGELARVAGFYRPDRRGGEWLRMGGRNPPGRPRGGP